MKNRLLIACLCQLFYLDPFSQSFSHKTYTKDDGLSDNTITCMTQDTQGFLWIGTTNGLNRFDGSEFDNFYNNPNDSTSIQSNEIGQILVTSRNEIWVSTPNGVSKYNPLTQTFSNYAPDTTVLPKIGQNFFGLHETPDGNIWVGTWYDVLLFNPKTKKYSSTGWASYVQHVRPINGNHTRVLVLSIVPKSSSELWVLTTYGLFSVNTNTLKYTYYPYHATDHDYYGCNISYVDKDENVFISSFNKGLLCYQSKINAWKVFNNYDASENWNQAYGVNPFSGDTLLYFNREKQIFFDNRVKSKITPSNRILKFSEAVPSNIYFGFIKIKNAIYLTSNNGLVVVTENVTKFTETEISNTQYLGRIFNTCIPNQLIVSSANQQVFYYNTVNQQKISILTKDREILKDELSFYIQINCDTAYFTSEENLYLLANGVATDIPLPSKVFTNNSYTARNIVDDANNNLYIRCRKQGIIQYNTLSKSSKFLTNIPISENNEYSALYFDDQTNNLWIALQSHGLYIYNTITGKIKHLYLNTPPSQRGGTITCIVKNQNDNIYFTDANNGLYCYDSKTDSISRFTTFNGLVSNNCFWITSLGNQLWVGTSSGLSLFNTDTQTFKNYNDKDGYILEADYFLTDTNGITYQTFNSILTAWNINDFDEPAIYGKIYLRNLNVNDKSAPILDIYKFKHFENTLNFTFGILQLPGVNPYTLEYQLNDDLWNEISSSNNLLLYNLVPKQYLLKVRIKNQPETTIEINFNIIPPFYNRTWFYGLLLFSISSFVLLYFRMRVRQIKKSEEIKTEFNQRLAKVELDGLRAQMNPHFVFNCLNSINKYILENDSENASSYLTKFSRLIRLILDNSKEEVISLEKELSTISLYIEMEKMRFKNRFDYVLNISSNIDINQITVPPMMIQPYVENAIWHGLMQSKNRGLLTINILAAENKRTIMEIIDNGVGREKAMELKNKNATDHKSLAMKITSNRLEIINSIYQSNVSVEIIDLYDSFSKPIGTKVVLNL